MSEPITAVEPQEDLELATDVARDARSFLETLELVASGAAGADRSPVPYLPEGLRYDPQEGAGEVQTPLLGSPADDLLIGDKVWFRHAKAGELCERFDALHLVEGDRVDLEGWRLDVVDASGRRAARVLMHAPVPSDDESQEVGR